MKSMEITEKMVDAMESGKFDFLRCNFPNGDMVGHTGVLEAVIYSMECVDNGLKAILSLTMARASVMSPPATGRLTGTGRSPSSTARMSSMSVWWLWMPRLTTSMSSPPPLRSV